MKKIFAGIGILVVVGGYVLADEACEYRCEQQRTKDENACWIGSFFKFDSELYKGCMAGAAVLHAQCVEACRKE